MENLDRITETLEGYLVKDLRYNKRDNILIGMVLDPVCGRPSLREGYVTVCWNLRGRVIDRYGGTNRRDLEIDIKKTH